MNNAFYSVLKLYESIEKRIGSYLYHLTAIDIDHRLIAKGWKVNFAVDYHQVYSYAFPFTGFIETLREQVPSDAERIKFVERQAAIGFVFEGLKDCPTPILLPPHAIELGNTIVKKKAGMIKRYLNLNKIRDWSKGILSQEDQQVLEEAFTWIDEHKGEPFPENLLTKTTRVTLAHFKDLLYLLLNTTVEGFERIQHLFDQKNPKLKFTFQCWPEYDSLLSDIAIKEIRESDWFEMFSKVRGKWDADYRDSQAIEMILALNKELMTKKAREILLLVSDAESMDNVLNWDKKPELIERFKKYQIGIIKCDEIDTEIRLLRTSETFLVYLLNLGDSDEKTMENLDSIRRSMLDFHKLKPILEEIKKECAYCPTSEECFATDNGQKCEKCDKKTRCDELRKGIINHKERVDQLDSVRLFLNRNFFLRPHEQVVRKLLDKRLSDIVTGFIKFMKAPSDTFTSEFGEKEAELDKTIIATELALRKLSVDVVRDSLGQFRYFVTKFQGFPHSIKFENPEIKETLEQYSKISLKDPEAPAKLYDLTLKTLSLTDKVDDYNESKLLLASLFYSYGEYTCANYVIDREIARATLPNEFEYRYVQCLALNRQGLAPGNERFFHKAMAIADQLIRNYPMSPRTHYLYGMLLGRGIQARIVSQDKVDQIVQLFETAYNYCENRDRELRISILNNIIFMIFLSEKYTHENVLKAMSAFDLITKQIERSEWPPHLWDTVGCLRFMQSFVTSKVEEQVKLVKEAKENIENALEIATSIGFPDKEKKWMLQNREKVMKRLSALENPPDLSPKEQ
jgi:hypothetical protein